MTMASGLYTVTFRDAINDGTPITMDLTNANNLVALYTDTKTPVFDTDAAYSSTNELATAGGYTQISKTVGGTPTCALGSVAHTLKYSWSTTVSWTSATFTARGMIVHTVTATKLPIVAATFGADYTATNGTFTITAHADGIFYITMSAT